MDFLFNLAVSNAALMHQTLRWLVGSLTPSGADLDYLAAAGQLPADNGHRGNGAAPGGAAAGAADEEGEGGDDAWEPAPAAMVVQDAIITTLLRVRKARGGMIVEIIKYCFLGTTMKNVHKPHIMSFIHPGILNHGDKHLTPIKTVLCEYVPWS